MGPMEGGFQRFMGTVRLERARWQSGQCEPALKVHVQPQQPFEIRRFSPSRVVWVQVHGKSVSDDGCRKSVILSLTPESQYYSYAETLHLHSFTLTAYAPVSVLEDGCVFASQFALVFNTTDQ